MKEKLQDKAPVGGKKNQAIANLPSRSASADCSVEPASRNATPVVIRFMRSRLTGMIMSINRQFPDAPGERP
jgi:hypothetical protein